MIDIDLIPPPFWADFSLRISRDSRPLLILSLKNTNLIADEFYIGLALLSDLTIGDLKELRKVFTDHAGNDRLTAYGTSAVSNRFAEFFGFSVSQGREFFEYRRNV